MTPLGQGAEQAVSVGPVTIAEVTDTALASVAMRMGQGKAFAAAARSLGIPLPAPGRHEPGSPFATFWLGPEQWMVEAQVATHEDIVAALRPAFGASAAITEQTDAWARLDMTAPDLPKLFERLCAYDLRTNGPGSATRTMIEHLGCYVIPRTGTQVSVIGPRSSAASLLHAIETAARSVF
jgi:sarcosine oxidase, subunit gamma